MKKFFKRFLLLLLLVFIGIQFFRPAKNKSEGISANDITAKYAVPDDVKAILKTSCYDCHSKLEGINGEIKDGEMPLTSYTLIHGDAKLNEQQKLAVANWVTALRDSIKSQYPEDSLKKPKQAPTK